MEKAIFITKTEDIRYVGSEYGRLYFGNEFCERLIPSISDIKLIAAFVIQRKIDFTFVTPYVTNQGIDILRVLFEYISKNLPETEIVVNDWGVLKMLKDEFSFSKLSLGRLLTKQERDPRSVCLKNKASLDMMEHFRDLYVDSLPVRDFLKDMGISRVELDNSLQGITRLDPLLNASLYFPFVYLTASRYCFAAKCEREQKYLRSVSDCDKECRKYVFMLRHKNIHAKLILKGNSQFFRNETLPDNFEQLNIDRLVYQPEIPV